MSGNAKAENLLAGFIAGTIGLGCLLIAAWVGLWLLGAFGGPQWQMPLKLLYSGGSLIFLGYVLRILFSARSGARSS